MVTPDIMILKEKLRNCRVVPVVSLPSVKSAVKLAEILVRCGLPVVEITFRTASALDGMEAISRDYPELLLLAGTVLTIDQARRASASGAAAIVSPGFSQKTATYCALEQIAYLPGVCTPSEVQAAMDVGLDLLKFFPAENAGGVGMLSLFGSVYQGVSFMPTGGINQDNITAYLAQANVICCGGTWLSPKQLMVEGRWEEIERRVNSLVRLIRDN